MASPSVQHARPVHRDRGPMRVRGRFGTATRFEAGFRCGFDSAGVLDAATGIQGPGAPAVGSQDSAVRVTGSARRCRRRLASHLRQHRDILAASVESRRSLQAALDDLSRWDRQQRWTRQVLIDDLPVTYWLRADDHAST